MSFLSVNNLTIKYENFALRNIDFQLEQKDFLTIIGPSGAGKSTIFDLIIGFRNPHNGSILLDGEEITKKRIQDRNIGVVFQNYALFEHMSVYENIDYGLKNRDKSVIHKIAEKLTITHLLNRKPKKLSGGEKQRVAFARALAAKPKLLLLDEPFSSLDTLTRKCMRKVLHDISTEFGITVILITHDIADAKNLANKIAFIQDGNLLQFDTCENLFCKPKTPFIANFLNTIFLEAKYFRKIGNLYSYECDGAKFLSTEKSDSNQVNIAIRPENVFISRKKENMDNALECTLSKVDVKGTEVDLTLQKENFKLSLTVNKNVIDYHELKKDGKIFAHIKAENVHIIKS